MKNKSEHHNHTDGQKCFACEHGADKVRELEQDMIKKHGWFIHYVPEDYSNSPVTGTNIHTHHLDDKYGHPDIQIIVPLPQNTAIQIIHNAVDLIADGAVFNTSSYYDKILGGGYNVRFIEAEECDRKVLRMILPDKDGFLEESLMKDEFYKSQFTLS